MKITSILGLTAAAVLTGCNKESSSTSATPSTNSSGESVLTAPVDYLNTITKQQQNATKKIDVVSINKAIQLFQVQEGRNPKDLNELVEMKYMPMIPETPHGTRLDYDATAGTVKVVNE